MFFPWITARLFDAPSCPLVPIQLRFGFVFRHLLLRGYELRQ